MSEFRVNVVFWHLATDREVDAMTHKPRLYGRELSNAELEEIRLYVESFDIVDVIDDEMRDLIAQQWPDLAAKIKPPKTH